MQVGKQKVYLQQSSTKAVKKLLLGVVFVKRSTQLYDVEIHDDWENFNIIVTVTTKLYY